MAKRNDPVSRARGRKPAPVKKPFPVGFAVGSATLAALLIAILAYAATNQGLGDKSSLRYAESKISGLSVNHGQASKHVGTKVSYPNAQTTPPDGGDHNATAQSCQVYTSAVANEHAVHSLEHGAVWVTYNPLKVSKADIDALKKLVDGDPYRLLSPYPGLKSPISLQAWGEQLFVDRVSDKRVKEFLDLFTNGPQARERGGACQGTTDPGPLVVAPTTPPTGAPSATPTPTATK